MTMEGYILKGPILLSPCLDNTLADFFWTKSIDHDDGEMCSGGANLDSPYLV